MRKFEKLRKSGKTEILKRISLLAIATVSLISYEKTDIYSVRQNTNKLNAPELNIQEHTNSVEPHTNNTRESINIESMVTIGSTFAAALRLDRNSMDMG